MRHAAKGPPIQSGPLATYRNGPVSSNVRRHRHMQSEVPSVLNAAFAIAQFWFAPILALATSAIYFATSPPNQKLSWKLGASAHGASIAALYVAALVVNEIGSPSPSYGTPFTISLLIPCGLILLSLNLYKGRKSVHVLQLINIVCIAWTFFIGSMAITGNWL